MIGHFLWLLFLCPQSKSLVQRPEHCPSLPPFPCLSSPPSLHSFLLLFLHPSLPSSSLPPLPPPGLSFLPPSFPPLPPAILCGPSFAHPLSSSLPSPVSCCHPGGCPSLHIQTLRMPCELQLPPEGSIAGPAVTCW